MQIISLKLWPKNLCLKIAFWSDWYDNLSNRHEVNTKATGGDEYKWGGLSSLLIYNNVSKILSCLY